MVTIHQRFALFVAIVLVTVATAPNLGQAAYNYAPCATGSHGIDCTCPAAPADPTVSTNTALVTSITFHPSSDGIITATLAGALDQTRRTVTTLMLGNTPGHLCYEVPQASWSCDSACSCTTTVSITTYAAACHPSEVSLDSERMGFTVYAIAAGQDVRDTDAFGQPLDPVETIALAATSSTTVTTRATFIHAVQVGASIVTVTISSITIIPRTVDAGDTDAELEIALTMVTPADYDVMGSVSLAHLGSSGVDADAAAPAWSTLCGTTCTHSITILLATGDLTADPAAACDFSGTTTLTNAMDATAACYVDGTCTDPFDLELLLVEAHSADACNPADDTEALVAPVEPPVGVVNPDVVVTTPGEPTTVAWESTVVLDGIEYESALSSIKAAMLPPGTPCTADGIQSVGASEVFDSGAAGYADIGAIFTVSPSGLGHSLELSVDSSATTAQTLDSIATDESFRSSFSGVFCFVVAREVVLLELPSRLRRLDVGVLAVAPRRGSAETTTARSSASIPITLMGLDESVWEESSYAGIAHEVPEQSAGQRLAPCRIMSITTATMAVVLIATALRHSM